MVRDTLKSSALPESFTEETLARAREGRCPAVIDVDLLEELCAISSPSGDLAGLYAALANHGRAVRVPLNRASDLARIFREKERLKQELGREPTPEEIAERMEGPSQTGVRP